MPQVAGWPQQQEALLSAEAYPAMMVVLWSQSSRGGEAPASRP